MMLAPLLVVATAHALAPTAVPTRVDVAIAGGGLGGLAACAAMRARGIDAHCFEAAGELLRGSTGTGIMISANGMSALGAVDKRLPAAMRAPGRPIGCSSGSSSGTTRRVGSGCRGRPPSARWSGKSKIKLPEPGIEPGTFGVWSQDSTTELTFL